MGSEWPVVVLSEVSKEITVGFVGSMTKEYVENGVPFLRSKNILAHQISWDDMKYVSAEFHKKLKKSALHSGDVAIVRTGKPGTTCVIPSTLKSANCSDLVIVRPDTKRLNPYFLSYFMNSVTAGQQINSHVVGAVQQHFNVGSAKKIQICLPSINEQEQIVCTLRTLDNKIQLNRQTNQTLEQMAQALFKSWFVDFDPVIDNALAAGKPIPEELQARAQRRQQQLAKPDHQPLPDEVRQLFPSEFEETDALGWVPKGWRVEQLVNKISILNGFAFKSKDYTESGTFVLRTKNFKCGMTQKLHDDVYLPDNFLSTHESYLSKPYDYHLVMVGNSLGNRGIIFPQQLPALRNQNMWCFRTKDENVVSQVYVKFILDSIVTKSLGLASGSAREFFRKGDFGEQFICFADQGIQSAFKKTCADYIKKQGIMVSQITKLENLRDTLLPKLISGELRLPESMLESETNPPAATAYE
jgi:type I restriction enzyme S subunit